MSLMNKKKIGITFLISIGAFCFVNIVSAQYSIAESEPVLLNSIPEYSKEKEAVNVAVLPSAAPEAASKAILEAASEPASGREAMTSQECVSAVREAAVKNDLAKIDEVLKPCMDSYEKVAQEQEASLNAFPVRGQEDQFQILNDMATAFFTKAEALMNSGKTEEAIALFQKVKDDYKWAQSWDPRGWFWSVAEKSQASIDVLTGKAEEEEGPVQTKRTIPTLEQPGTEKIVDYLKYGKFIDVGSKDYNYEITDHKGLSEAVGEGIYPNAGAVFKNDHYKQVSAEGRLKGTHWDFVNSDDLEAAYYKWLTAPEPWGVKLFYIGMIFEKAKMYHEALKAYRALVVHFPPTVAWTYWQTPWYPAQAAIAKIRHIIRIHPELNLEAKWMKIEIANAFDNDTKNDIIVTYPGILKEKGAPDTTDKLGAPKLAMPLGKIKKKLGTGKVQLAQYANGHWQMLVDGKPYIIKGITYAPTKVGQSPDKQTLKDWMEEDSEQNGRLDGPYDSWVDANGNNKQDADEPTVGDFQLMKEMGVNTIRRYHQPFELKKEVMRDMYQKYGIRIIMGDYLGKYAIGSGASWFEGTDYENPEHRKNMMESVKKMVMEYKDEPYILMWLLGNENNYGVACNADKKPEAYYQFVNEVAEWIKSVDKNHPVAIGNGDALYLDIFARLCPAVDIFGANIYRGDYGFGSLWEQVAGATGKPAFITEYGAPAYAKHLTLTEGEQAQADYHIGNWLDIQENLAGNSEGVGNALGGVVFEWLDEWWKNYDSFRHDKKSDAIGPFPGGYYYEEWFGIVGQGDGQSSPFLRHLRKAYYKYKGMWEENKD